MYMYIDFGLSWSQVATFKQALPFRPRSCQKQEDQEYPEHDDVMKWKHFFALLDLFVRGIHGHRCFPSQRPVARSFDVFYDLRLNKRLSKQSKRR